MSNSATWWFLWWKAISWYVHFCQFLNKVWNKLLVVLKMAVFWVAPCSLVEVYRRFRALMMEVAASTSETSINFYQTTRHDNPQDSLHTCSRENLKFHIQWCPLSSKTWYVQTKTLRSHTVSENFNLIAGKREFVLAVQPLKWFRVKLYFCKYKLMAFHNIFICVHYIGLFCCILCSKMAVLTDPGQLRLLQARGRTELFRWL
jgi:hypothetical protein